MTRAPFLLVYRLPLCPRAHAPPWGDPIKSQDLDGMQRSDTFWHRRFSHSQVCFRFCAPPILLVKKNAGISVFAAFPPHSFRLRCPIN